MERADHFLAQDRTGRCGQELRNSGGAAGRSAKGNSRSREKHSLASRKSERRSRPRQIETQKISAKPSSTAKAATRFVMRCGFFRSSAYRNLCPSAREAYTTQRSTRFASVCTNVLSRSLSHHWQPHRSAVGDHIAPACVEAPEAGRACCFEGVTEFAVSSAAIAFAVAWLG